MSAATALAFSRVFRDGGFDVVCAPGDLKLRHLANDPRASFLLYDFLFTQPVFTFTVRDPREWLNLLLFLLVGIVVGRLAGRRANSQCEPVGPFAWDFDLGRAALVFVDVVAQFVNARQRMHHIRVAIALLFEELRIDGGVFTCVARRQALELQAS